MFLWVCEEKRSKEKSHHYLLRERERESLWVCEKKRSKETNHHLLLSVAEKQMREGERGGEYSSHCFFSFFYALYVFMQENKEGLAVVVLKNCWETRKIPKP